MAARVSAGASATRESIVSMVRENIAILDALDTGMIGMELPTHSSRTVLVPIHSSRIVLVLIHSSRTVLVPIHIYSDQ